MINLRTNTELSVSLANNKKNSNRPEECKKNSGTRLNILLVGEESAGSQVLRTLAQSNHRIVAVMASPSKKAAGGTMVWNIAERLGYPTWPARLVKDPHFADKVYSEAVDILLNVHSLFIINKEVLNAPRIGSFNMHPGLLPRWAGLNTVSWAIYRGEKIHGVTIHKMVPEIDAGPIVYQSSFPIEENDTALSLTTKCVKVGVSLVSQLIKVVFLNPDTIPLVAQDLSQRRYFGAEIPNEGRLSWSLRAGEVVNFIRACDFFPFPSPWGYPRTRIGDQEIAIVKACRTGQLCDRLPGTVGSLVESGVLVACADEWILVSKVMIRGQYMNPITVLKPGDRFTHWE
jgi:methionyl-tRNA formyltransferase